jgi:catalase (peroxidase I)
VWWFGIELRAFAEVYGCDDAKEKACATPWRRGDKVMSLDRFDLA